MKIDIIARVARMGAKRGCAWRLTHYQYDTDDKKCRYITALTRTFFPNKFNESYTKELIMQYTKEENMMYIEGRPTYEKVVKKLV